MLPETNRKSFNKNCKLTIIFHNVPINTTNIIIILTYLCGVWFKICGACLKRRGHISGCYKMLSMLVGGNNKLCRFDHQYARFSA